MGENVSVTILATGFVTNPNQLLQPKKEPEKFNLNAGKEKTVQQEESFFDETGLKVSLK